jgi:hypothetical protein
MGRMMAHIPHPQRQVQWARIRSATIVPMYRVGMVVSESGRVDQTPRLTREVMSATNTCCVRAYPVDPMASNIPAAYFRDCVSVKSIVKGRCEDGENQHFGSAKYLKPSHCKQAYEFLTRLTSPSLAMIG